MRSALARTATLALTLLAGLIAPANAQTRVRVAYDGFSMTTAPMQYALSRGIFRRHGLDVDLTYVEGGSVLTQAFVGGSIDIAQNGYTPAVAAAVAGADLVIIGGIANILPFMLVVDGSIRTPADLKGKNIAISRYGSSTDTAARLAVESLGLSVKDVNILQIGNESVRSAALISKQVQGTMAQLPNAQDLIDGGARLMVDVADVAKDFPNTGFVTSRAYLKKNPDVVKRFMMAMAEGVSEFRAHPEDATAVTAAFLKLDDNANLRRAVTYYGDRIFQRDLRPSPIGIAQLLKELAVANPAAAAVKPEQIMDTTIIDDLAATGFFKTLK